MSDAISTKRLLKLATKMSTCVFPCLPEVTVALVSLLSVGLAKRVGARLLLASTSEVYGGKWVGLLWGSSCLRGERNHGWVQNSISKEAVLFDSSAQQPRGSCVCRCLRIAVSGSASLPLKHALPTWITAPAGHGSAEVVLHSVLRAPRNRFIGDSLPV